MSTPYLAAAATVLPKAPADDRAARKARRLLEHQTGRLMARRCLVKLDCGRSPAGEPGAAPRWPEGYVGSITHGGRLVAAIAARDHLFIGVGIDVEPLTTALGDRQLVGGDLALPTMLVTAREAAFKCGLRDESGRWGRIKIDWAGSATAGTFTVPGTGLLGRWRIVRDHVVSVAVLS